MEYLIIYIQPKVGLQIQVRKTYKEAQGVVKTNGGYIVKTAKENGDK